MKLSSPLPWRVLPNDGTFDEPDRCQGIVDADGDPVVTTDSGVYAPDAVTAAFLVHACNNHEGLLGFIRAFVHGFSTGARSGEWYIGDAHQLLASIDNSK